MPRRPPPFSAPSAIAENTWGILARRTWRAGKGREKQREIHGGNVLMCNMGIYPSIHVNAMQRLDLLNLAAEVCNLDKSACFMHMWKNMQITHTLTLTDTHVYSQLHHKKWCTCLIYRGWGRAIPGGHVETFLVAESLCIKNLDLATLLHTSSVMCCPPTSRKHNDFKLTWFWHEFWTCSLKNLSRLCTVNGAQAPGCQRNSCGSARRGRGGDQCTQLRCKVRIRTPQVI